MNTGPQTFALDVQSVSKLKYSAQRHPDQALKKTAQQFEAMFLQQMLEKMRDATPKSDLTGGQQMDMVQSLMDKQWGETLSKRGIGLADMLTQQLTRGGATRDAAHANEPDGDPLATLVRAEPTRLAASAPVAAESASTSRSKTSTPASPIGDVEHTAGSPLVDLGPAEALARRQPTDAQPAYVQRFVDRMGPAAARAARETGVPAKLVLAQAALETGWGRHETPNADGSTSYNVFNIKTGSAGGPSTNVTTQEYVDGRARRQHADFRVYGSYDEAFADYARLLSQSPRYASVVDAPDAAAAARALQTSGYATDPAYADKLVSVMAHLPEPATGVGHGLFADQRGGALVDIGTA